MREPRERRLIPRLQPFGLNAVVDPRAREGTEDRRRKRAKPIFREELAAGQLDWRSRLAKLGRRGWIGSRTISESFALRSLTGGEDSPNHPTTGPTAVLWNASSLARALSRG
jgi:hypothetical protein